MGKLNHPTAVLHDSDSDESCRATNHEPSPPPRDVHYTKPERQKHVTGRDTARDGEDSRRNFQVLSTTADRIVPSLEQKRPALKMSRADSAIAHNPNTNNTPQSQPIALNSPRYASLPADGRGKSQRTQDRTRSFLDSLHSRIGDAQASPPHERNPRNNSPIDTAVRRIQKTGFSARAKALQTAGALLTRIYQGRAKVEAVRSVVFITCVDVFQRDPLDNIEEISLAFQLFSILVQEGIMQGHDFVCAAEEIFEEEQYAGCSILLRLIFDDKRIQLTDDEPHILNNIASDLNL